MPGRNLKTAIDDLWRAIRNLYNCNLWHKCLHADLLDGKHGSEYQDQCALLDALCALTDNGLLTKTGDGTVAGRTITAGDGVSVANGNGVAADPVISADIAGLSDVTMAAADLLMFRDDTDGSLKKGAVQDILDLAGGGDFLADGSVPLTNYVDFTEISEPTDPGANVLRLWAEDNNGFSFPHLKDDNGTAIELARDSVHVVRNNTGSTITAGTPVYFNGSTGVVPTIAEAQADAESTLPAVGILPADIGTASFGLVVTGGDVSGFDTSGFSAGDILYVSASAAGTLTATTPSGDSEFIQRVGVVVKSAAGAAGIVAVQPTTVRPVVRAIANGGTGASDENTAIDNIVTGATLEASIGGSGPTLTDLIPVLHSGGTGGKIQIQYLLNAITNLAAASVALGDELVFHDDSNGARKVDVEDFFTQLTAAATNDTSPNRQVEFIARDGSGNLRSVLFDDLHPNGQAYVQEIATYTGSGSTGKTVTLTGINRTHHIEIFPVTGATAGRYGNPDGATGAFATRYEAGTGVTTAFTSLDAPAAGTAQTLTLTTGDASVNSSGVTYMVFVVGTPT